MTIKDDTLRWERREGKIAEEAALGGWYAVRTNEPADKLSAKDAVRKYKQLELVERVFRTFKGMDLRVRPIHHRLETRVRCHLLLCLLAYYVEWHMRKALAPLLYDDECIDGVRATRDPVAPAEASESARRKKARASAADDTAPVAWTPLLSRLGTLVRNECALGPDECTRTLLRRETTQPPWQRRAYQLLADYP